MRIPRELKRPGPLFRAWLVPVVGMGVLLLVLLFFASIPLGSSPFVLSNQWPRARFLATRAFGPGEPFMLDASGVLYMDGKPVTAAAAATALEADARRRGTTSVRLSADRHGPWRALRAFLRAALQAELEVQLMVALEGGGSGYLTVCAPAEGALQGAPVEEVWITKGPPEDPTTVRSWAARNYGHRAQGQHGPTSPILRFAPDDAPDVQAVVSSLECYADSGDRVYLKAFR